MPAVHSLPLDPACLLAHSHVPAHSMIGACLTALPLLLPLCCCLCVTCLPAGGQGAITPDDVAQAVLFCFRLSKNAVPEEVGGEGWAGWLERQLHAGGC